MIVKLELSAKSKDKIKKLILKMQKNFVKIIAEDVTKKVLGDLEMPNGVKSG